MVVDKQSTERIPGYCAMCVSRCGAIDGCLDLLLNIAHIVSLQNGRLSGGSCRSGFLGSAIVGDHPTGHVRDRPGHAPGSLRLTSCTTQLLPSGSLKERNEP